jgi:mRNA interferase MazF
MTAASPSVAARARRRTAAWVPQRGEVIWIDCNPQAGAEMRDFHPMLVLSPEAFNGRTGLVIGLPMTTAACNATNPFALPAGAAAGGRKAGLNTYILCHQPKSFDWRARGAKPHPQGLLEPALVAQACTVLNQIVQLA